MLNQFHTFSKMNKSLKRKLFFTSLIVISFFLGGLFNGLDKLSNNKPLYKIEDVVLISRSPKWKYGLGFYVAVILIKKSENGFNVSCKIHVGNHNYFQNVPLGSVSTIEEAYHKWGVVSWANDALIIGSSIDSLVTIKRKQIEQHR